MALHRHPLSPLLDSCPATLPREAYVSPQWFADEQRAIWARIWVYAGRLNDLPPMVIKRVDVAGDSIFLFRDPQDRVRAYHNTCRHRGAELCAADGPLRGRLITCPYHQWEYGLDGALVSTGFDTPTGDFR